MTGESSTMATLRRLAVGLTDRDVDRLLERVAQRDEADELRAALVLVGAAALLRERRASTA